MMAVGDQWQALPPFWAQTQADRTRLANLDLGQGLILPHEPRDLVITGEANYNDEAPVGGSGPRSVFRYTGALTVSFRVSYSRFDLVHRTGSAASAIEHMEIARDWFEAARFPVDQEDGWEGSAGPLLLVSIPNVLEILCNLRRLRMVPDRDLRSQLRRLSIQCTFHETLSQRYTCSDVWDVGMFRVDQ